MRLCEQLKIVPIFADVALAGGATGDSINMKNYHSACFIILSATTNWTAGPDIKLYTDTSAGGTDTAMTFSYRIGSAAVGSLLSDVLTAWATSAELAMDNDHEGFMYIIEVEASEMTDGHNWLSIVLDSDASAGEAFCIAILTPRFPQLDIPTALA